MKIAITYNNGMVFQHFGHTEAFKIYDVEENQIMKTEVVKTIGEGHGALASFLKSMQVEILICGGIGGCAQEALKDAKIKVYGGVSGDVDEVVNALLNNKLIYNENIECDHHNHDENHQKDHHCGGNCH